MKTLKQSKMQKNATTRRSLFIIQLVIFITLTSLLFIGMQKYSNAATFISIQNGSWNDAATWNINQIPGTSDIIYVEHNVIMNWDISINTKGTLHINADGMLSGPGKTIFIYPAGQLIDEGNLNLHTIYNWGTLNVFASLEISGGIINSGNITNKGLVTCAENIMNSGYIIGTGGRFELGERIINSKGGNISGQIDLCSSVNSEKPVSNNGGYIDWSSITICNEPMFIELTDFTAHFLHGRIEIYWQTASEINIDHYTVETSSDGILFRSIGILPAADNGVTNNSYHAVDINPKQGTNFYRIKETNLKGNSTYSSIISVEFDGFAAHDFFVFPNPFSGDNLNIVFNGIDEEPVQVVIYDMQGEVVYVCDILVSQGKVVMPLAYDIDLAPNYYIIQCQTMFETFEQKFIVQ